MGQLKIFQSTDDESLALLCQMHALTAPVLTLLGHQRRSKSSTLRPDERSYSYLPGRIPQCSSSQGPLMHLNQVASGHQHFTTQWDVRQGIVAMVVMQHLLQHCPHGTGLI